LSWRSTNEAELANDTRRVPGAREQRDVASPVGGQGAPDAFVERPSDVPCLRRKTVRVPETERDDDWKTLALMPAAKVDYASYRNLAEHHITGLSTFYQAAFLPEALAVASANADWKTFDAWLVMYRELPEALRNDHASASVINLEGLRALREGRIADATSSMQQLLERASTLTFLSNKDVSSLPEGLRQAGLCTDLCDAFDEQVAKRDWRHQVS
jgi:hypothetical protein